LSILLVVSLALAALCASAQAWQGSAAHTANLGDWMDRVKLRAEPSQKADVLGQYFAGVNVTVLDVTGDWAHVRIGTREGFLMRRFLENGATAGVSANEGILGEIRFPDADGTLPLLAAPDKHADTLARMADDLQAGCVTVLGTVGEHWLHVHWYTANGDVLTGFAASDAVTQAENMDSAAVDTGSAVNRLHLRAAPSQSAASLGRYFSGTRVYRLFDDHVNGDGWERVRVMDAVGYMMQTYLDYSTGGISAYMPPLTVARHASIPVFDCANAANAADTVTDADHIAVLGERSGRLAVQIGTGDPFALRYGYVDAQSVTRVTAAASTLGVVCASADIVRSDGQGMSDTCASKGAQLRVYGSAASPGEPVSQHYVQPGDGWLLCDVEVRAGTWMTGFLPADAVAFDPALVALNP
jgi:uncharacterized protein YgiM (DUF1202 family)